MKCSHKTDSNEFSKNTLSTSSQEEASRGGRDDRPSISAILSERKMDSSSSAGNHNKVKVMATQLLAKFEENAPAQQTGLKRQVGGSRVVQCEVSRLRFGGCGGGFHSTKKSDTQ